MVIFLAAAIAACQPKEPPETVVPQGAAPTHRGVLIGKSDHDTTGALSVYRTESADLIVFEGDFRMSPVAGTLVALGRDGVRPGAIVAKLLRQSGHQVYIVPTDLRSSGFNEIWLWDPAGDRPLGLARLRGS